MSEIRRNVEPIQIDDKLYDTAIRAGRQAVRDGTIRFEREPRSHIDYQTFLKVFRLKGHGLDSSDRVWRKYRLVDEFLVNNGGSPIMAFSEEELYGPLAVPDNLTMSERHRMKSDADALEEFKHEALMVDRLPQVLELETIHPHYGSIKKVKATASDLIEIHGPADS